MNAGLDAIMFAGDGPRLGGGGVSVDKALDQFADLLEDEAAAAAGAPEAGGEDELAGLFG